MIKVLLACHLPTLFAAKASGISACTTVSELHAVRYEGCPKIEKVRCYRPVSWASKIPVLKTLAHLIKSIRVAKGNDINVALGIYLVPYGIIAYIVGAILHKPCAVALIGTDVHGHLRRWYSPVLWNIVRHFDAVGVQGEATRNLLIQKGVDESRIQVLRNVLDFNRFKPSSEKEFYDIAYVGRLVDVKNPLLFLDVVDSVKKSHPKIKVALVGNGPLSKQVADKVGELSLSENVDLLGFRADVEKVFARSKVFVLTSTADEMPFTVFEAGACGLPAVVADVGNLRDFLEDGKNGFLVPSEDIIGYANRIKSLLSKPKIYNSMREHALKTSREFSGFEAARRWERLFDAIKNHQAK